MTRRALICGYGVPQHDRDSGSQRLWSFIRFLHDDDWTVDFLAASTVRGDERYVRDLLREGVTVHDGTVEDVQELISNGGYGLALCAFWQVAELYLPLIRQASPSTCVILDSVDLQFVRDARRLLSRWWSGSRSWLLDVGYGAETAAELNTYGAADAVLAVSPDEAQLVGGMLSDPTRVFWVPDAEDLPRSRVALSRRSGILFVGSFRHAPNLDALEYLSKEIVPLLDPALLERHPITIVGDGLDKTGVELVLGVPHVRLVGWVPSLDRYLRQARITVVPLRYGAGTKRKMIQALMTGTPTVATSVGIEGLGLRPGRDVLLARDASSFAEAITRLLEDDALWRRLSRRGRTWVEADHSVSAVRSRFLKAIEAAVEMPRKPPMLVSNREVYERRTDYQLNQKLIPAIRRACSETVPRGSTVSVISGGSAEFLRIDGYALHHFPPRPDGAGAGPNPHDSEAAIALVDEAIGSGTEFLLIPKTLAWWLTYYPELTLYLEQRFTLRRDESCTLVDLRPARLEQTSEADVVAQPTGARPGSAKPRATLVAFYLPQFHPIPENDQWWGEGFTEWTNVAKAQPLFERHYQPHLPADLGFYDLRSHEVRKAQADMAREAGISAFCYYHYWFGGKRLLSRPFDEVLATGEPDFPFCLCWANEPWSRRWDGRDQDVLQQQTYSEEDDLEHIRWLIPALSDRRALKVEGKPVFVVYQAKDLPDPARTADTWRREIRKAGLPGLHLLSVETGWDAGWDATKVGFDAKILFQPNFSILQSVSPLEVSGPENLRVYDYEAAWPVLSRPDPVSYRRYETVCAGWDNSPRAGEGGWVLHNSSPEAYERWLGAAIERAQDEPPKHRLIFLNGWNEWAEGAHLEPDRRHGRAYLEATRSALETVKRNQSREDAAPLEEELRIEVSESLLSASALDVRPDGEGRRARAIAFYLPQFHPIPENDEWWEKGFTEWTNVARAKPLFERHYQPHLPAHLGFYDLRVPEVRERQADLAAEHGIEAFCYWHYWFLGKRLLGRPFSEVLASGRPDFPFCLAWANETWSRRWLGEDRDILIKQEYSAQDDVEHIRWLLPAFADRRYLRVGGRPLFVVYKPYDLPDPKRTTALWRETCVRAGLEEPFLLGVNAHADLDFRDLGFDGTIDFEPHLGAVADPLADGLEVVDYAEARRKMWRPRDFPVHRTVLVGWDNTPRRGEHGVVFVDSTPEAFEAALRAAVASTASRTFDDRLLFLNAWNEWAEGNHLEPDRRHGLGYLQAVRRVIVASSVSRPTVLVEAVTGA
jgi:lipopolysaccharide biosynthesis protein/glycosyltransferase involved in cell wall biosynthesis